MQRFRKEVMMKRNYARLDRPLIRQDGVLRPTSMDRAIAVAAEGLASHRGEAFGLLSCSKATNETNYLAQKFARVVMASNNIDSCNRT
jgi:formate dehydrogenase major subunit